MGYLRARGAGPCGAAVTLINFGLSPRTRRLGSLAAHVTSRAGCISAYAEAGSAGRRSLRGRRVYFRVRGGWARAYGIANMLIGRSPRMRRQEPNREGKPERPGSISACTEAGDSASRGSPGDRVYLRARGGWTTSVSGTSTSLGLSPRTRRLETLPEHDRLATGSISAHAEAGLAYLGFSKPRSGNFGFSKFSRRGAHRLGKCRTRDG